MASKTQGVWGLDIGQCALKALRCTVNESGEVVAEAFDYIEYPKLLSQPEADREELIKEAMSQFLSRNSLRGDKVAIAVSGTSGLSRFFKPPPVEMKRIADIVKFEARQQIPFPIEDVVWDYQPMGGMVSEDGIVLDTEIGLFAMKRDLAFRSLEPFQKAGIKIDLVQLGPLALFNLAGHELLPPITDDASYDAENPPESIVILSIGTDTSDMVITNGYRVWQRNIPLGGNHFTKQLTKELKLTFAKAEHLKRNIRAAEDARSVVQAMRPTFNDLVNETQRSIGFFLSLDRKAKIKQVYVIGNTVKLPGLVQYLEKNLSDYKFGSIEAFDRLTGPNVVGVPSFKDNVYAFGTCYGLCLQGLGKGYIRTNLLPREIAQARMIEAKKPWAVASLGALLLGCSAYFGMSYLAYSKSTPEKAIDGTLTWASAEREADSVAALSTKLKQENDERLNRQKGLVDLETEFASTKDRVLQWPNLLYAIRMGLPESPPEQLNGIFVQDTKIGNTEYKAGDSVPYSERRELFIEYVESLYVPDLSKWLSGIQTARPEEYATLVAAAPADASGANPGAGPAQATTGAAPAAAGAAPALTGEGFIIEIGGYHFNNSRPDTAGKTYVQSTLINHLRGKGKYASFQIPLPAPGPNGEEFETVTLEELGVSHAIQIDNPQIERKYMMPNPNPKYLQTQGAGVGGPGGFGGGGGRFGGGAPGGAGPAGPPGGGSPGGMGPGGLAGGAGLGGAGLGGPGMGGQQGNAGAKVPEGEQPYMPADRYSFRIQFAWKPTTFRQREEMREAKRKAAAEAAAASGQQPGVDGEVVNPDPNAAPAGGVPTGDAGQTPPPGDPSGAASEPPPDNNGPM